MWRRFSGVERLNFWSISLDFVQKLSTKFVLLSKTHSHCFVKVRILEKNMLLLNFEWKNGDHCCRKRKLPVQGFLEQKQGAVSFFGYRAEGLQSVLSKVQSNCPVSFLGKIIEGLQKIFLELWPVLWRLVLSELHYRCAEEQFLWKSFSWKLS